MQFFSTYVKQKNFGVHLVRMRRKKIDLKNPQLVVKVNRHFLLNNFP